MTGLRWLGGLLAHRRLRLVATAVGAAIAVGLVASIGAFLSATTSHMTRDAAAGVAVDWQVEAQPGATARTVVSGVASAPGVVEALPVRFAPTTGLTSQAGGSQLRTGPGAVVGLPPGYRSAFPGEIRPLVGSPDGVVLAQQTAANLHAVPGSIIRIGRSGLPPATVRIAGVVDLPSADSLFQKVGAPPGAQATAPPDNVVLMPSAAFSRLEGTLARTRPELVRTQVHARLARNLPSSPSAAYTDVTGRARNLETRLAGAGLVGDNLGTALGQARDDALYAQLLFLFLGLPGVAITALVTASLAGAGAERRRREAALLRTRGATTRRLVGLAGAEALAAGGAGALAGLAAASLLGRWSFGTAAFGAGPLAASLWATGAVLAGLLVAGGAILLPAWRDARRETVAGQRRTVGRADRMPWWARAGLDVAALAGAGLLYLYARRSGYTLVLAPEGVPQVSVNWLAVAAPVLAWIGGGLLVVRLVELLLRRATVAVVGASRPVAGNLSEIAVAAMRRRRRPIAHGVALLALSLAFAGSTAVFNATYAQQAEVDARLTNGGDVTVTESPGAHVGPSEAARLARVPGVASVEPLQHRFAYVGADLQDLYGVRPSTIGAAGKLQDTWFQGGSARSLMNALQRRPDGVLVSAETVHDFQLNPGDLLRLRLQRGGTGPYRIVPFHYVGVAKEFPTAPLDSFLVANADYVAKATGSDAVGTFLVQTDGASPSTVARRIRADLGAQAKVTDIETTRKVVGSSLTAVELTGLTRIELVIALVLAVTASGLTLGIGFAERRRSFSIAVMLGARARQLGGLVVSESALIVVGGLLFGAVLAVGLSQMLVTVLTGVFDPPPDTLAIPWPYAAALVGLALVAVVAADALALRAMRRSTPELLRDI